MCSETRQRSPVAMLPIIAGTRTWFLCDVGYPPFQFRDQRIIIYYAFVSNT